MADEFAEYKKAISNKPDARIIEVYLPDNTVHKYHYDRDKSFAAVIRRDGSFLRFIPHVRLH